MRDAKPRIVERTRAFDGWNKVDVLTVEATDAAGVRHRLRREIVDHGSAAVVLTIDRTRGVALMARQWRTGLLDTDDPYLLEACAGLIDPGETPEETARREAAEEIGYKVGALRSLGTILPSIGTVSERMYLFVAEITEADRLHDGGGIGHEGEDVEVIEVPLAELYAMAETGRLRDAKTLVIVQRLMLEARAGR